AADQADQALAVDQRMGGETPLADVHRVFTQQLLRPVNLARVGVEAKQVPHGTERVDLAIDDDRRAARTGAVRDLVFAGIFVLPEDFAGRLAQTEDAFGAGNLRRLFALRRLGDSFLDAVGHVNLAIGDGRPRVARVDRRAPANLRAALRKLLDDAGFA